MYKLTLEQSERSAIDWVGYRYAHGDDLYKLLIGCDQVPDDIDWGGDGGITFVIPEHVAWQIKEIGEECNYQWDCFASGLSNKMNQFVEKIV